MLFLIKWKRKEKSLMADIKLNSDSDDVGTKFKIIGISVTLGLNAIVFIWYFFFSGLTWALSLCNHDYEEWEDYMFTLSKENT